MRFFYLFIAFLLGTILIFVQDRGLAEPHLSNYESKVGPNMAAISNFSFPFDLKIEPATFITLSEHNRTAIKVIAAYDNNTTEDVTLKAAYHSNDGSVDVDKGVIITNAEGSATVTVTYGGKNTTVQVEVYEMADGHLLPHAPQDPDATLLGVDANKNGVRDDVERWIYKEMPTKHHPEIERVIAMQDVKVYQLMLMDPANKDNKVYMASKRSTDCYAYYIYSKKVPTDNYSDEFDTRLQDKQFNTKERLNTYINYNYSLKGKVFILTPLRLLNTNYCDANIDKLP